MEYMDYPHVERVQLCVGCIVAQNSTKTAKIPGNYVYQLAGGDCHAYQVLSVRYFLPFCHLLNMSCSHVKHKGGNCSGKILVNCAYCLPLYYLAGRWGRAA